MSKNSAEPGIFFNIKQIECVFWPFLFFSPSEYAKLVLFLNAYFIIQSQGRPYSIKGTPLKHVTNIPSQKGTPLASKFVDNEKKQADDLDDIAKKLEQVSHKLGRPVSGHVPAPFESDELNSDFPSIQLIRSDQVDSLKKLPSSLQELCIIEDLLFLVLVTIIIFHIFFMYFILESWR
mgnify:CR=1 FL=1